jgi:signal transduction histidine kinase
MTKAVRDASELSLECKVSSPGGATRIVHSHALVRFDEDRDLTFLIGSNRDVTEERHRQESLELLAEAGAVLSRSLDYTASLARIAELAVPRLGDVCIIYDLVDQRPRRVKVSALNPERARAIEELEERFPADPAMRGAISRLLRSGRPLFVPRIRKRHLDAVNSEPERRKLLQRLDASSLMVVPLVARTRSLGFAVFLITESNRRYERHDFSVAQELAARTAQTMDNALVHQEVQATVQLLNERTYLLEAIDNLAVALAREQNPRSIGRLVTDAAADLAHAQACMFFATDWTGSGAGPSILSHTGTHTAEFAGLMSRRNRLLATTLAGTPVRLTDVTQDPDLAKALAVNGLHEELLPIRSYLAVPIVANSGRVVGGLLLGHEEAAAFSADHQNVVEALCRWAGVAIENARLHTAQQATLEDLRKANDAKSEFMGIISHELRSPITTIYGGARTLNTRLNLLSGEDTRQLTADLESEAERLYRLVQNLLVIAQSDLGIAIPTERVVLKPILARLLATFSRRRPNRKIRAPLGATFAVIGVYSYVEQVLYNLLSNADKYSPVDEPIVIKISNHGDDTIVRVLDRGPGIPEQELGQVFGSFYRSSRTTEVAPGQGIGLAVCRRLVDAINGRIWATNRPGGGLEICVAVPRAKGRLALPHARQRNGRSAALRLRPRTAH